MKLSYQTGIAALIQLGVITVLNIVGTLASGIQRCTNGTNNCVSNLITSMLYFIVTTLWFLAVWIIAAGAQSQRSRKLSFLLLGGEGLVLLISLFNAHHHNNLLGLVTSLTDAALAVWVALLACRLILAGGGRVTSSSRSRRRRLSKQP